MIERSLFTPEHEAFRSSYQRFADREIAPFHEAWEDQGYVDREVWRIYGGTNEIMKEVITRSMGLGGK